MERHGSSVSAAVGGTASLASDLVTITLMSMASGSVTVEPQQKKLPSSMTVARLKQLCERVFKVSSNRHNSRNGMWRAFLMLLVYRAKSYGSKYGT